MRVLILNGANQGDSTLEQLGYINAAELKKNDHEVNLINLYNEDIASCLGCFGCWVKTPGVCVIDDTGRNIAKSVVQSDLVITITPITFGGYSYQLKKALDRIIPIISPFFMKIKGEFHHKPRYERYPNYISVGMLPEINEEQEETFRKLVTRNALNFHSQVYFSSILYRNQSPDQISREINQILQKVGA